ncbi:transcriptional regulator [Salmonella phage Sepoy]|uniref:Uncharacterized protein n=1 Tax=Salmonella phage Sepoy TaxID=2565517 RepID=A0A4P8NEZ4_9CAUD|nr:transcriptional regulator [Salmonella phage Sepoy]QCQ65630.1 hypothetical protein Sepoy_165 [Salmonella phage Sepoy]
MSKLTDLLKAGDVKYLQRDCRENSKTFTMLFEFNVDADTVKRFVPLPNDTAEDVKRAYKQEVELSLDEALADDWGIIELDV